MYEFDFILYASISFEIDKNLNLDFWPFEMSL